MNYYFFQNIVHSETLVGSPLKKSQWNLSELTFYFLFQKNSSQWNFGGLTWKKNTVKLEWTHLFLKNIDHSETLVGSAEKKSQWNLNELTFFFISPNLTKFDQIWPK